MPFCSLSTQFVIWQISFCRRTTLLKIRCRILAKYLRFLCVLLLGYPCILKLMSIVIKYSSIEECCQSLQYLSLSRRSQNFFQILAVQDILEFIFKSWLVFWILELQLVFWILELYSFLVLIYTGYFLISLSPDLF